MVSLKKTILDKTIFSPEHETCIGLEYVGRKMVCLLQTQA